MWRRVPCEQQLNMGQSVLRNAEKSVTKVPNNLTGLIKKKTRTCGVYSERELG